MHYGEQAFDFMIKHHRAIWTINQANMKRNKDIKALTLRMESWRVKLLYAAMWWRNRTADYINKRLDIQETYERETKGSFDFLAGQKEWSLYIPILTYESNKSALRSEPKVRPMFTDYWAGIDAAKKRQNTTL